MFLCSQNRYHTSTASPGTHSHTHARNPMRDFFMFRGKLSASQTTMHTCNRRTDTRIYRSHLSVARVASHPAQSVYTLGEERRRTGEGLSHVYTCTVHDARACACALCVSDVRTRYWRKTSFEVSAQRLHRLRVRLRRVSRGVRVCVCIFGWTARAPSRLRAQLVDGNYICAMGPQNRQPCAHRLQDLLDRSVRQRARARERV